MTNPNLMPDNLILKHHSGTFYTSLSSDTSPLVGKSNGGEQYIKRKISKLSIHILLDALFSVAQGQCPDAETCETIEDIADEHDYPASDWSIIYNCTRAPRQPVEGLDEALKEIKNNLDFGNPLYPSICVLYKAARLYAEQPATVDVEALKRDVQDALYDIRLVPSKWQIISRTIDHLAESGHLAGKVQTMNKLHNTDNVTPYWAAWITNRPKPEQPAPAAGEALNVKGILKEMDLLETEDHYQSSTMTAKANMYDHLKGFVRNALSAPVVPAGWKLVPIEPTPEMLEAGFGAMTDPSKTRDKTRRVFSSMLSAAPQPQDDEVV